VETEARLSVSGSCSISWPVGYDDTSRNCLLYTVPAGKRLAIRSVSVWCAGNTGQNFTRPWLTSFVGNVPEATLLGFSDDPGFDGYEVQRWLMTPLFQHASAGKDIRMNVTMTGQATNLNPAGCSVRMQGFLLDEN
jgi:hypothetical protein